MTPFLVYDTNGNVIRQGWCQERDFHAQAGVSETVMRGLCNEFTQKVVNGELVMRATPLDEPKAVPRKTISDAEIDAVTDLDGIKTLLKKMR